MKYQILYQTLVAQIGVGAAVSTTVLQFDNKSDADEAFTLLPVGNGSKNGAVSEYKATKLYREVTPNE